MNWRPWILSAAMFAMVFVNAALLWFEDIDPPEGSAELTEDARDPLLAMKFIPSNRKTNFKDMFGGDEQLASAAAGKVRKLEKRKDFFREKIQTHADEVSSVLCPTSGVPQRYAAMSILVEKEGEELKVLNASRITYLEIREWYAESRAPDIYSELEMAKSRYGDATLMGVAAILLQQDDTVMLSEAPWNHRGIGRWSWGSVKKRWPQVENQVIDYFALMHLFTEIANDVDKGICL